MLIRQNDTKIERPNWAYIVKATLKDQGRSQVWLARKMGMDSSQLRNILRGDARYRVTVELLSTIAALLQIPDAWLLAEPDDPTS